MHKPGKPKGIEPGSLEVDSLAFLLGPSEIACTPPNIYIYIYIYIYTYIYLFDMRSKNSFEQQAMSITIHGHMDVHESSRLQSVMFYMGTRNNLGTLCKTVDDPILCSRLRGCGWGVRGGVTGASIEALLCASAVR